ncbi:hypothetical protein DTO027B5_50 [Paecilomyces variotii]|nr:hypothetical protein DTO027B3_6594 [Paecilomyces variotii]KAJ9337898.1 hypothetical protein DTO027B5_50 [Paecilomyces variotii]
MFIDLTLDSDEELQKGNSEQLLSLFTQQKSRKRKSELTSETSSLKSDLTTRHVDINPNSLPSQHNETDLEPVVKSEPRKFDVVVPRFTDDVFSIDSDSSVPRKKRASLPPWNSKLVTKTDEPQTQQDTLLGLSQTHYPVDDAETKASFAYPKHKHGSSDILPLSLSSMPPGLFRKKKYQEPPADGVPKTLLAKLSRIRGPPVTLTLSKEDSAFPENFEFINSYKIRGGVEKADASFDAGCDCGIVCDMKSCTCLSQEIDSDDRINPYDILRDGTYVLNQGFLKRSAMIYECTPLCACTRHCWNRVVERGRTIRFNIFDTGSRGFGLRSPDHIRAGQFIDLYLGEVITKASADRREMIAETQKSPSYLFSLDFLVNDNKIYVVDGQKFGSPTRFMNHSCNPNCKMFPVSRHHGDERLYDLAFFALRDIPPMTELTFDYNPSWDDTRKKKNKNQIDPNSVKSKKNQKRLEQISRFVLLSSQYELQSKSSISLDSTILKSLRSYGIPQSRKSLR